MPPLHPVIIHFPIALFVMSLLLDTISVYTRRETYLAASKLILVLSWIGTGVALVTGDSLKDDKQSFLSHQLLFWHENLAIAFAVWLTLLVIIRLRKAWRPRLGYLSLMGVGFVLLLAVGHTGGSMAWSPGISLPKSNTAAVVQNGQNLTSNTPANGTESPHANPPATTERPTTSSKESTSSGSTTHQATTKPPASGSTSSTATKHAGSTVNQALYTDGANFFVQDCQSCHSLAVTEQYYGQLSPAEWDTIVRKMQGYSGQISDSQAQAIEYYLIHHHA